MVELLDEASSLDHTPVELVIEIKYQGGSAVCPPPLTKRVFFHGDGG